MYFDNLIKFKRFLFAAHFIISSSTAGFYPFMKRKDRKMQKININDDLYNHVQKLELGQEVKNYKQLCALLNKPDYQGGCQRKSQLQDFQRYFAYQKVGRKFVITDIFDTPLAKEDKRKMGNNRERYKIKSENYLVDPKDNTAKGAFKIQFGNLVYIGKTTRGFRAAFRCYYNDITEWFQLQKRCLIMELHLKYYGKLQPMIHMKILKVRE